MQKSKWSRLDNTFDNATSGSFKKTDILATDHNDKLLNNISDPDIADAYTNVFKPAYDAFKLAFTTVLTAEARYGGRTRNTEDLWKTLTANADDWSFAVEATPGGLFRKNTLNYSTIFPNGYAPFQKGAYEQRVRAVASLIDILGDYTALANVKNQVTIFYNTLLAARTEQQGFENELAKTRTDVANARQELVDAMHRIMGLLLYKYAPNTAAIDDYYDLTLLRTINRSGSNDNDTLPNAIDILPAMQRTIANGVYDNTNFVKLINTGAVDLQVWSSNNETSTIPSNALTIAPEETITISVATIADGSTNLTYIIAANADTLDKGKVIVIIE